METADRKFDLLPGFCALMRPGGIYDAGQDPDQPLGLTFTHFEVLPAAGAELDIPALIRSWPEFYQLDDVDFSNGTMRRIVPLARSAPEIAADYLRSLLRDILQRPSATCKLSTPQLHLNRISTMIAEIHSEPGALPKVADMAHRVGMSPSHFSRIFHQVTGESPRDFLVEARTQRARHLLEETDFSVKEISERLGYTDIFFFSRQFKEKTGFSPSSYRTRKL